MGLYGGVVLISMSYRDSVKVALFSALFLMVCCLILQQQGTSPLVSRGVAGECNTDSAQSASVPVISSSHSPKLHYLSYQPPGNGWNNQRIALENALVLAKLLNRTLLVHPLAPHELGMKLKGALPHGYMAYNMLNSSDLLPPSQFLDLKLMSQVTKVEEVNVPHPQFVSQYSGLTWRNVCHTPGFGFWVDQLPTTSAEVDLLLRQKFVSLGRVWKEKCPEEEIRTQMGPKALPFIQYVSDLQTDDSEMLYFEHGTLFGIQIRFTVLERALQAQKWVVEHVQYNAAIWTVVKQIRNTIGPQYNAIQVRRRNHMDSKLQPSFWMEKMVQKNFSRQVPVYVATDDDSREWFKPFRDEGYRLYFASDLDEYLSFPTVKESLRSDYLGLHEQCICVAAAQFVGSPASTFNALILRHRGEVELRDRLMTDTLHTYWIGHQVLTL